MSLLICQDFHIFSQKRKDKTNTAYVGDVGLTVYSCATFPADTDNNVLPQ